ncbi:hypothetical protein JOE11_004274 [Robbsia andropogonis]|uniref:hypothetical protein n=1 Tax=Robbsia andropogonis TaxID=28092 RepID=UPI0012F74999|nr:hypothetical protein [Robbsia andropogonis]MCP1118284.1 hypothetical protein [Robbsia andropogonis]MCP1127938.1 hypothetical protein [Robbsia andropogonis]
MDVHSDTDTAADMTIGGTFPTDEGCDSGLTSGCFRLGRHIVITHLGQDAGGIGA